jgi:hypothetical protein
MSSSKLAAIHTLNGRIAEIDEEILQAGAEVDMLRHLDDDARRDALVTDSSEDRQVARMTAKDLSRAERYVERLRRERAKLVEKRDKSIQKLARS